MSDRLPPELVIDAGPIIGAVDAQDQHHAISARGLRVLYDASTRVLIPAPILFEAYKRIAYRLDVRSARTALAYVRDAFDVEYVDESRLIEIENLIGTMPWWRGSLEDATLAILGLERAAPVWTFNYRDMQVFTDLQFWTPG
jgi:hypothetical protein